MTITKRLLLFATIFTLFSLTLNAQHRNCGSMHYLDQQIEQNPERKQALENIERHTQQWQNAGQRVNGVITIPTVVHVLYTSSASNISDAQIQSQIDVLNADFRRTNSDANNTWSQAADSEIEFCLASVDPNGNATNGITRTATTNSAFGTNDAMKFSSSGGVDAWPTGDYLNMWVCGIGGGILGYAQFPGGSAATDGVVCDYRYFGTMGTAQAPFDLGRTTTHEVGHWLNLRHIWGDGNCNADDFVSDTPTSDAANYGCASGHVSCNSTDMVENYMDYSDDACMNLYTQGQKNRMRALFDPGGFRASLLNSNGCGNGGGGGGGGGTTCTDNEVTLSITFDNYPEETAWSLADANGATVASGGTYGSQADGSTLNISLCLVDGCYDFTITDAYGDGICCQYGNGAYSLTDASGILVSGASFTSSETTNFCVGNSSGPTCTDGVQNGDETGVDCGGSNCPACPTCNDGVQNGNETGVDCGGSDCPACPTCNDGVQNGNETGVDCGGSDCPACPTCNDGVQNGDETGVDCGGSSCPPCGGGGGCTDNTVTLSITLDNYPEETAWSITDGNGSTVASGGTYGSQADGSTVTEEACLPDGCYTFTITDAYGDGICCQYGNGSYTLTGASGTLASGGSFGSSEATNFCVGSGGGGGPTCSDGIQNGDETGVDCGGSNCPPCGGGGGCTDVLINSNDFEAGWGIWNDGGSDCYRSTSATYAASGTRSARLRDNTSTSTTTTDNLDLTSFEDITVSFNYVGVSMDNANEDFWLQISTNGGSTFTTVEEWNRGDEFENNIPESDAVTIVGPFSSTTKLRFRCDASGNSDWVYIDDVVITGCTNGNRIDNNYVAPVVEEIAITEDVVQPITEQLFSKVLLSPNPAQDFINMKFESATAEDYRMMVTDLNGSILIDQSYQSIKGRNDIRIDASQYSSGLYLIHLIGDTQRITKKVVIAN